MSYEMDEKYVIEAQHCFFTLAPFIIFKNIIKFILMKV